MGYFSARDMREHATEDQALRWHLTSNHYPPLPESILLVAKRAIRRVLAWVFVPEEDIR